MANVVSTWTSLLTSWATLVGLFLSIGYLIDERLLDDIKQNLAKWLQTSLPPYTSNWYRKTNEQFQFLFDEIYGYRNTFFERILLVAFVYTLSGAMLLRVAIWFDSSETIQTVTFLSSSLFVGTFFTFCGIIWNSIIKINKRLEIVGRMSENTRRKWDQWIDTIVFLMIVLGGIAYFISPTGEYIAIFSVLIGIWGPIVSGRSLISFDMLNDMDLISPSRSLLTSLFFITCLGMVFLNTQVFSINTVSESGVIVIPFIIFNIFADTVSLSETRWVLKKSHIVSISYLPLLLIIDLLLSACIYLFLPIISGQNLHEFFKGIQFTGTKPWIGVLFWSTFSTSVIFYLFMIAVLVIQVQKPFTLRLKRIGEALQFEENPTFFIAIVMSLLVTLIYAAIMLIMV